MATVVIMPRQGQSVESCIFTKWFKQVGDKVEEGDILFAYETDKASFEEEASEDGVLLATFCQEGDEVPVLQNIALIGKAGERIDEYKPGVQVGSKDLSNEEVEFTKKMEDLLSKTEVEGKLKSAGGKVKITPRAKKLALDQGVPFETLLGSGPNGRVIERDVQEYLRTKEVVKHEELKSVEQSAELAGTVRATDLATKGQDYSGDYEIRKMPHIRKLIAKAMLDSLQNSAQLTHHLGADARRILELRKQVKKKDDASNITLNDMVCLAVIEALKKFPDANAHCLGDSIKYFNKVNLGLAVDTDRGLMVPVIKNADDLSISGLSRQIRETVRACREGSIDPEVLSSAAASFTVSNLGNYGVEMFTPVINLPQVAILGVNTIVPRPADLGGGVYGFVPFIGLSLTYDHRALDGGIATRFLKQIAIEIETLEIDF